MRKISQERVIKPFFRKHNIYYNINKEREKGKKKDKRKRRKRDLDAETETEMSHLLNCLRKMLMLRLLFPSNRFTSTVVFFLSDPS